MKYCNKQFYLNSKQDVIEMITQVDAPGQRSLDKRKSLELSEPEESPPGLQV